VNDNEKQEAINTEDMTEALVGAQDPPKGRRE